MSMKEIGNATQRKQLQQELVCTKTPSKETNDNKLAEQVSMRM